MSGEPRKDVDETILAELKHRGYLSPSDLRKACTTKEITRATYFRHLGKLKKLMQIEEIIEVDHAGRPRRKFRNVNPKELAEQRDINLYLSEINNADVEIMIRGLRFFSGLCGNRRVAWYFSPRSSPEFNRPRDIVAFFRKKLLQGPGIIRLEFLKALENMIQSEPPSSIWRSDVIELLEEMIEEIALRQGDVQLRKQALRFLIRIRDLSLVDLGFKILEESTDNVVFQTLFPEIEQILIKSEEALAKKPAIREKLDELTLKGALRAKVHMLLEGAPP